MANIPTMEEEFEMMYGDELEMMDEMDDEGKYKNKNCALLHKITLKHLF